MTVNLLFYDKKWNIKWRDYFILDKVINRSTKTNYVLVTVRNKSSIYIMDKQNFTRQKNYEINTRM